MREREVDSRQAGGSSRVVGLIGGKLGHKRCSRLWQGMGPSRRRRRSDSIVMASLEANHVSARWLAGRQEAVAGSR